MKLKEIAKMDEWTLKEALFVIGAVLETAKRRQTKKHDLDSNGNKMIMLSRNWKELTDRICDAFRMASSHLYADRDAEINRLFSRALLWLTEHKDDPYDQNAVKQYFTAGIACTRP